jgi:hypothetical protein
MAHLCKNAVEAFWFRDIPKGYWFNDRDLENAIIVAEDFITLGCEPLWLTGYDLNEFIAWARAMLAAPEGTLMARREVAA